MLIGLRYPYDYLKVIWYSREKIKSALIKSVLVLPGYRSNGIAILLSAKMPQGFMKGGYERVGLSIYIDG